jgi:hypothetical protein
MDILDQIGNVPSEPVELTQGNGVTTTPIPTSALRNRAAVTTMLSSEPKNLVQDYQASLASMEGGNTNPNQAAMESFFKEDKSRDTKAVMSVLSDPSLTLEQKQGAVNAMKVSPMLTDSGTSLITKGLEQSSDGETIENEDARISTADALREMYDSRDKIQGLVNAHGASLNSVDAGVAGGFLEMVLAPFATSVSSYKLAKDLANKEGRKLTAWESIKALTFNAGSTIMDVRQKLATIPPSGQVEYTNAILSIIKDNSGVIFTNDNQFNQFQRAQAIFAEGGYDNVDKFIDNASFLLDIIGVGQTLRSMGKVPKVIKAAEKALEVAPKRIPLGPSVTVRAPDSGWEAKTLPTPTTSANSAKIDALQEQISSLMGDAGNNLEKGQVASLKKEKAAIPKPNTDVGSLAKKLQKDERLSFKEASAKANKIIADNVAEYDSKVARIDGMLESNAKASTASQRIDALEKQITELQKDKTQVPMALNPLADAMQRISVNSVVRTEHPASIISMVHNSNPKQARGLFEAIFKSEGDAVAEGLAGVGKTQAIINDVYPQALTGSRAVTAKATDIQRGLRIDPELSKELQEILRMSDVGIHYSREEMQAAKTNILRDFSSSTELVPNDSLGSFSSGFKVDGTGIEISAVYGTKEGAFLRATDAVEQAKYALKGQGIVDADLEVLKKTGNDYSPVSLAEVGDTPGSYLVRVNMRRDVDPTDITKFDEADTVRLNFFDRAALAVWDRTGSVSRWLLDAASMLPKRLTGAAAVATDVSSKFEKQMLNVATLFSDEYNKLSKERRAKVDEYIKEANFKEIAFDQTDLIARGFMPNEIKTLRNWRDFWDANYYLENFDVVRTLNAHGFQMFRNATTELYAKPIAKNSQLGKMYDPLTDSVVNITPDVIDDLYNKGGTIARLRRPTEFTSNVPTSSGTKAVTDSTEYMIVRNTPNEYLRKFRDSDAVLNYKDGYYQIRYKAPRFIDEISFDSAGRETGRKAVAVAGDTAEAQRFADKQAIQNPDKKYNVRHDKNEMSRGSDDWFDVNSTKGRVAQRHRGKLLEDATGINHLGDGSYIVNPVESAIRASKSIAGRTVNRPMLEAAKARALDQFKDVFPSNGMGGSRFPNSVSEIGAAGKGSSSHVADARTTFEYIHYLENGYINSIDEFVKAQWNNVATALGERGFSTTERMALRAGEATGGPTSFAKNFVFQAYIGTNVLRNWIVQTNQVVRTFAYNTKAWLSGSMPKLIGEYGAIKSGLLKNPSSDGLAFTRFMDESGLLDSVDKQNLVRGSLLDAAGSSSKTARLLGKAVEIPRKVGFDAGESMNLLGHGAAVFDRWKRAGHDMTDIANMREAHSELRAISYDMNFAGDMVYNQTSAAAILQFMQVPHKAFLQATNRRIPADIRARMIAADLALWGTPIALVSTMMGGDIAPEDDATYELFLHGAQGLILNRMFTELLGEDTSVDFTSLAPYDMEGWGRIFHSMMTGGLTKVINNSPAGQLFLADGGRVQSAFAGMSRFFSPWTPGERTPEEAMAVANEVAKIASGWNNAMKARQMFALGKSFDKYGNVIDPNVNSVEAAMQLFGFGTMSTKQLYETQSVVAEGTKAYEDEVKAVYKEVKQYYQNAFAAGIQDPRQMQAVTGQLLEAYRDSPDALNIIQKELSKDITGKDIQLLYMMMKSVGIPEHSITVDQIRKAPISDEQKDLLISRLNDAKNVRSEINKEK